MPTHTDLVARISEAGAVPADRPADTAQRITAALTLSSAVGVLLGLMIYAARLSIPQTLLSFALPVGLGLIMLVVWRLVRPPQTAAIPVVARTLATTESAQRRYLKSGPNRGLVVPVVVQPVADGAAFRSVVMLQAQNSKTPAAEPPVGTLLMLHQTEAGIGELSGDYPVTPAQEELRDRLLKHPRMLSNNAPALPMRRGVLERKPFRSGLQWWVSFGIGAGVSFAFVTLIAGV
ncbi:MAG: hypothetical protein Q4E03_01935 [Trueperella sp.]|nr:hypothetical protein [Trueperella sp.]